MKIPFSAFLTAAALSWLPPATGLGQDTLLKDINESQLFDSLTVKSMVKMNTGTRDLLIIAAADRVNGTEIWSSDGTGAGTSLIQDIVPGTDGSDPTQLTAVGNRVYFSAKNQDGVHCLWVTDGTAANTLLLKEFTETEAPAKLTAFNGRLIFEGFDPVGGRELWESNGTVAGTKLNKEIRAGASGSIPDHFYNNNNAFLYFTAFDDQNGREMWRMDTSFNATLFKDTVEGPNVSLFSSTTAGGFRAEFTAMSNKIYFVGRREQEGTEPFVIDNAGALTVANDVNPGSPSSNVRSLKVMAIAGAPATPILFFSADDGVNGQELFRFEPGTTGGTLLRVKDIVAGFGGSDPDKLTVVGNTLFFTANNGSSGTELFRSNGTTTSSQTDIVTDIFPGSNSSNPTNMTPLGSRLVFTAINASGVNGIYSATSSGGAATVSTFGTSDTISPFIEMGGKLYFLLNGSELWSTDGISNAQTAKVKNFMDGSASSFPTGFARTVDNTVFFSATSDAMAGAELWKTDGTRDGTVQVKNIRAEGGSSPSQITPAGSKVYFAANSTGDGNDLWVSDGTEMGTVPVLKPGSIPINTNPSEPRNLTAIGDTVYFSAVGTGTGREPWKADATGATLIGDIAPSSDSNPSQFIGFKNSVYFVASSSLGTRLRNIATPDVMISTLTGPKEPTSMIVFGTGAGQRMYFAASDDIKGKELWKSDGTNEGTECIDINPDAGHSNPKYLTVVGNAFYFVASENTKLKTGNELWRSTGSLATTKLVKDILPGFESNNVTPRSSNPENLIEAGGKLFFTAFTPETGRELWVSDGTAAGTKILKDIIVGAGSPGIQEMRNVDGLLMFSANDGVHGREVWISDGTPVGTILLEDLAPLSSSSNPSGFIAFRGQALYAASTLAEGNEPRLVPVGSNMEVQQPADTLVAAGGTVDFGSVAFKSNTTLTFTIKNTGKNVLKDIKPLISGINASEFTLTAPKPLAVVSSNAVTTMGVKFTPKEGGVRRAQVAIYSNDGDTNPYVVVLQGTGIKDPEITLQPASLMRNVGESASFSSAATGTEPLALQWKKGAGNITGATSTSFGIPAVTIKDAGAYSLFVKGTPLTAISNPAELGVVEDYNPPLVQVAGAGKVATIKLNAAGNQQTYQWFRKRVGDPVPVALADDALVTGSKGKILVIKGLTGGDTALYTCQVTNPGAGADGVRIGGSTQVNVYTQSPLVNDVQNMPNGVVGGAYSHQVKIDTDPARAALTYSASGLPPGLKIDAKTGLISGRPTKASPSGQPYKVVITAKNTINPTNAADIVTDPQDVAIEDFPTGVEGVYAGIVEHDGEINGHLGGRLDLTVTKTGAFSGSLMLGASKLPLKGAVNVYRAETSTLPEFELTLKRAGKPAPEDVKLKVQLDPVTGLLTSLSRVTTSDDTALITGWRKVGVADAAQYEGYYTFGLRLGDTLQVGGSNVDKIPQGWSFGSFTVAKDGKLTFAGRTADGDKITGASFVGVDGDVVLFQTMYTPLKGSLLGSLEIEPANPADKADNTLTGNVEWVRPADPKSKTRTYVAGFGMPGTPVEDPVPLEAIGSAYIKPVGTAMVFNLTPPVGMNLAFRYGGISSADPNGIDLGINLIAGNKVEPGPAVAAATKLNPITAATGAFTGGFSLSDPDPLGGTKPIVRKVTFQGMLIKDSGNVKGVGFFTLPQLPATGQTITTSPIFGGRVELDQPND